MSNDFRPKNFDEYIGQNNIIDNLKVIIDSSKKRNVSLDHMIFHGSSGLGKTSLAILISEVMKTKIITLNGTSLIKPSDIISPLTSLKENNILFIDEIHAVSKEILEVLYPVLEDNKISVIIGKDYNSKIINIKLPKFTLVCATTELNKLASPFINRFPINFYLESYSLEDIAKIILNNSKKLNLKLSNEVALEIAKYTKFNPRVSLNILKRIYDYYIVEKISELNFFELNLILKKLNIFNLGLTIQDIKYLRILENNISIGIDSINQILDTNINTIINVIEPNLLRHNLITKTSRGRSLTKRGKEYLTNIKNEQ